MQTLKDYLFTLLLIGGGVAGAVAIHYCAPLFPPREGETFIKFSLLLLFVGEGAAIWWYANHRIHEPNGS